MVVMKKDNDIDGLKILGFILLSICNIAMTGFAWAINSANEGFHSHYWENSPLVLQIERVGIYTLFASIIPIIIIGYSIPNGMKELSISKIYSVSRIVFWFTLIFAAGLILEMIF